MPKINNPQEFKDLRPISILPVLSKVFEKIVAQQITTHSTHLNKYNILPDAQSGFRRGYSCTTAFLNITDDILTAIDKGMLTVLVMLDYSKAFDTISHRTLLAILHFIYLSVIICIVVSKGLL